MSNRLLKVAEVAERLGVTERFVRRLIAERRIEYVKAGTHVRIKEQALAVYIDQSTVEPIRMGLHSNGLVA
ncbi:helix-turn-helix domain-containing protein [Dactylosporangium sp. NPDC050688]|uniref:helix-turn-helix domain-containing protein n=1 Tax=Dactylosporangium sp. NPDC050688 TaxID=3157217 RepID=UPI0033FFDEE2